MPLFDYKCRKCGYTDEYIVKDYLVQIACPKCNIMLERQVAAPSFRLYGDNQGYYKPHKKQRTGLAALPSTDLLGQLLYLIGDKNEKMDRKTF